MPDSAVSACPAPERRPSVGARCLLGRLLAEFALLEAIGELDHLIIVEHWCIGDLADGWFVEMWLWLHEIGRAECCDDLPL